MDTGSVNELVNPIPAVPRRAPNTRALWTLSRVTIIAACLIIAAVAACAAIGAVATSMVQAQQRQIEPVIDEFMTAMARQDTDRAYSLFSDRGRKHLSSEDLTRMVQGNSFVLFDGYQRVDPAESTVSFVKDSDVAAPQGLVAQVSGSIQYAGGFTGSFEAVLERDGELWRLFGITVTVPPEKFGAGPW